MFFLLITQGILRFWCVLFFNVLCLIFKIRTDEDPKGLKCFVICQLVIYYEISSIIICIVHAHRLNLYYKAGDLNSVRSMFNWL